MTTPQFRRWASMVADGLVVKPLVEAYLRQGKFPEVFTVTYRDEGKERKPDGFFHPSTHPMWAERQLYYYLAEPDKLIPEEIAYENRMAMLMGTGAHSLIQECMYDAGVLIRPTGTCVACGRPHGTGKDECDEWGAIDKVLGRRGHMDGILQTTAAEWGRGLFEFKMINPNAAFGLTDNNLEWLKTRHLDYYAQVQDYLDMNGMSMCILLFCIPTFPFKLVEIAIPYDHAFMIEQKAKYRRVREMVTLEVLPDPCCAPRSDMAKTCPARGVCPIGRL